jgi:predicted Zn-dependent protease
LDSLLLVQPHAGVVPGSGFGIFRIVTSTPLCLLTLLAIGAVAAAEEPTAAHLDFARAILAQERGDPDAAAKGIEKARTEDPDALPLVTRAASIRMERHDLEGATTLYRELAQRHPERIPVQIIYADFLRDKAPGDDFVAKESTAILEAARKRQPGNLNLTRRLFRLYEQREKRNLSTALYEELVSGPNPTPEQVTTAAEFAKTLFAKDDKAAHERLDSLFRETLKRDPSDGSFARAASDNFRDRRNFPEAIEMLMLHVRAEPSSLELRTRLGVLLLAADREPEGEKELLDVVAIDPRQGLAHQSLAKLYRQQNRIPEALPHAAEALKVRGGSPDDFLELASEFLEADRPRDARLLLERAVYFHPDDASLSAKLAIATRRDPGTRANASRFFREAEQLSGEDGPAAEPEFLVESSDSLIEGGQLVAAEERLRKAIRAYPADQKKEAASAMRKLAGLWQQQGKNAEAAASLLKRADALAPPP